ncbi:E3 ubiquitin-protein ligase [Porphyridium purpureum]|uniref:E3 ubiquitin-protein ligase n=1 Tax=Porphyridium purpureum TaxID=35688 RepID=A0A5J4Z746_PORPP|nr:E3 ubiquitin-protein ligase [Porphyridium purpureum]|eukprot:POR8307..scf295_1
MALLVLIGWAIPGSGGCQTFSHVVKWFEVEWRRSVEIIGAFASDSYERVLESTSKADSYSEAQVMRATCWVVALLILSSTMSLLTLMFLFRLLAAPCLFFQEGLRMSSTQLSRDRLLQRVAPEFELDEVAIQKIRAHDEGGPSVCVICLESFEALDRVRRIPCSHLYHASCFLTWFRISMRCPLCNKNARVS